MDNSPDLAQLVEAQGRRGRGRPRAFDRDAALDAALRLFRIHGYDGASLDALTAAMGLSPSSLYSAFGDKERLFLKVLDRYATGEGAYDAPLHTRSGRAAIAAYLHGAARAMTRPDAPPGCLIAVGGLEGLPASAAARSALAAHRRQRHDAVLACVQAGGLPQGLDAAAFASLVSATVQGMAVQARDDAGPAALLALAEAALCLWPETVPGAPPMPVPVSEPAPATAHTLPTEDQRNARIRRLMI